MIIVTPEPEDDIESQLAAVASAFRERRPPPQEGRPCILSERTYLEARRALDRGAMTWLDQVTIEAVREGAQPGDRLPPAGPRPFIRGVADAEVVIHGDGPSRRVAVLFSCDRFPGVRFGHRFQLESPAENREPIWLVEEIETGALDRMMQDPPAPDDAGIIWTTWGD